MSTVSIGLWVSKSAVIEMYPTMEAITVDIRPTKILMSFET